jgi:hypothetical protein
MEESSNSTPPWRRGGQLPPQFASSVVVLLYCLAGPVVAVLHDISAVPCADLILAGITYIRAEDPAGVIERKTVFVVVVGLAGHVISSSLLMRTFYTEDGGWSTIIFYFLSG